MSKGKYCTNDIRLAAFILTSIPKSCFKILDDENSSQFKTIEISYPDLEQAKFEEAISLYARRTAMVTLSIYNFKLSQVRDAIRESRNDS